MKWVTKDGRRHDLVGEHDKILGHVTRLDNRWYGFKNGPPSEDPEPCDDLHTAMERLIVAVIIYNTLTT